MAEDGFVEALSAAFGASTDAEVLRAVREGVFLADDLIVSTQWLDTVVGNDLRGHLRRAGVMFRLSEACAVGDLPFRAEWKRMEKGSLHLLEITSSDFRAHVVRTEGTFAFPEYSETRQDKRLTNQPDLFAENILSISSALAAVPRKYAWLGFGTDRTGNLTHAIWGMPGPIDDEWLAHIDVSSRAKDSTGRPSPEPDGATTDPSLKLRFKDHIAQTLSDPARRKKSE